MMRDATMSRAVLLVILMLCTLSGGAARAQNCETVPEVIETLRQQDLGTFNLWDTIYGARDKREAFGAMDYSLGPENYVVAGVRSASKASEKSLILAEIDRRGRTIRDREVALDNLDDVVKLITLDDRYAVLANRKDAASGRRSVWIGFYDNEAALQGEAVVRDGKFDLSATDFLVTHDMKSLLVSVNKAPVSGREQSITALYWVNIKSRKVTRDVAYAFGAENTINALDYLGHNQYIGAGSMRGADNRLMAWIINVNEEGGFVWQKPYPRGLGSRLYDVIHYNDQYAAVTGETMPAVEGGKRAGWIMMVSTDSGDAAWQRYYREAYNLTGVALVRQADSQISVVMNGWDSGSHEQADYARLLTMNGRGVMMHADSFYNGKGAQARGMILGRKNERIVYGDTQMEYRLENAAQDDKTMGGEKRSELASLSGVEKVVRSREGWIVAASASEVYRDPCVRRMEYLQ